MAEDYVGCFESAPGSEGVGVGFCEGVEGLRRGYVGVGWNSCSQDGGSEAEEQYEDETCNAHGCLCEVLVGDAYVSCSCGLLE